MVMLKTSVLLKLACVTWIIILISPIIPSKCFLIETDQCVLDLNLARIPKTSVKGTWGGFLNSNCSGGEFHRYLYALGQRANLTGSIFLNSMEQRQCLVSMNENNNFENDMLSCGIEKLTTGGGGCSDFSVDDVIHQLPGKLTNLKQNCEGESITKNCGSCVASWESITSSDDQVTEVEADVCRFSVLVSLTSRMFEDEKWIQSVYSCLQDQTSSTWLIFGSEDVPDYLKIPREELYTATDNFNVSNLIGEGTAGKVYKGTLPNGHQVAIKQIISEGHTETFYREVASLSQIRHPNLVALLGFCRQADELFLVYELCVNGNLSEWLFNEGKTLSWTQRLSTAIDIASALNFLHTYPKGSIIHRDIKPTNILLSENLSAKLSDFGLSKVIKEGESFASSEVRGTFGYMDPEYQTNHHVNSAGDVYSFGVVLLQLLSAKKVVNMKQSNPRRIDKIAKCRNSEGFADPKLNGEYSAEAFELLLQLALSCTGWKKDRPSMEKVVKQISLALSISLVAKASTPQGTPTP
ncbi:hypothetical protein QQ045_013759 [Rhodiola kirilowii]